MPRSSRSSPDAPPPSLRESVRLALRRYLSDLCEEAPRDLHALVIREVEVPLLTEVLRHCDGNQTRAAAALGIHRATLRKKLRDYDLDG